MLYEVITADEAAVVQGILVLGLERQCRLVGCQGTVQIAGKRQRVASVVVSGGGLALGVATGGRKVMAGPEQRIAAPQGIGEFGGRRFVLRITSYNVCYTKLLRVPGLERSAICGSPWRPLVADSGAGRW